MLVALVIPYLLIGVKASGDFINEVSTGAFAGLGWFADHGHAVPPDTPGLGIAWDWPAIESRARERHMIH